jgi:hypothetical protein
MKRIVIVAIACCLLIPAAATAKEPIRSARVVFTPAPKGLRAGQAWKVRLRFFFRDGKPWLVSGLHPWITVRRAATGASRRVAVLQSDSASYEALIRFPAPGTWTITFHFDPQVSAGARNLVTLRIT